MRLAKRAGQHSPYRAQILKVNGSFGRWDEILWSLLRRLFDCKDCESSRQLRGLPAATSSSQALQNEEGLEKVAFSLSPSVLAR
jgi:hypothetical protein